MSSWWQIWLFNRIGDGGMSADDWRYCPYCILQSESVGIYRDIFFNSNGNLSVNISAICENCGREWAISKEIKPECEE